MAGDQITVKVHNYVKDLAEEIEGVLKKKKYKITETAIYDVMAKLLAEKFDTVNWNSTKSENTFIEFLINTLEDLQKSKDVKVKYRSIPKVR